MMLLTESKRKPLFTKKKDRAKLDKLTVEMKKELKKCKTYVKEKNLKPAADSFKKAVNILYKKKSDSISEQVYSVFEIIRMAIFIGLPFCIHPALGLLTYIVDTIISEKVNEKSEARVMSHVNRSIELCEERLKSEDITPEEKVNVEKMLNQLKMKKNNLENYYMNIKEYKLKDTEYVSDDDFDDDPWI